MMIGVWIHAALGHTELQNIPTQVLYVWKHIEVIVESVLPAFFKASSVCTLLCLLPGWIMASILEVGP